MKKIILLVVAVFIATAVMAQKKALKGNGNQRRMNPTEMVEKRTQRMVEKYSLTTEQAEKLKTLNEKYYGPTQKTSDTETQKTSEGKAQGHRQMIDRSAYNNELKSILTDTQYKAYEEELKTRAANRPQINK